MPAASTHFTFMERRNDPDPLPDGRNNKNKETGRRGPSPVRPKRSVSTFVRRPVPPTSRDRIDSLQGPQHQRHSIEVGGDNSVRISDN